MKRIRIAPAWFLALAVASYTAGLLLIKPTNIENLQEIGIANQEEYTYTDSEGEEHDGVSYIEIIGIGKVLTYKDVYLSSVYMFLVALLVGVFVYGRGDITAGNELRHIIFANCILGVLLIWLTSKETILPTILFWIGIIISFTISISTRE